MRRQILALAHGIVQHDDGIVFFSGYGGVEQPSLHSLPIHDNEFIVHNRVPVTPAE